MEPDDGTATIIAAKNSVVKCHPPLPFMHALKNGFFYDRLSMCTVALKEDVGSSAACKLNVTFGCDGTLDGVSRMWVRDGCRGVFICDGNLTGICGFRRWPARTECPCTADLALRTRLKSAWGAHMIHSQQASWISKFRSARSDGRRGAGASCASWACEGLAYDSCSCLDDSEASAARTVIAPSDACKLQLHSKPSPRDSLVKVAHALSERVVGLSGRECKDGEACKCTNHNCGAHCCSSCMHRRPRVLFAHIEKTGGSALECASQALVRQGLWVNMGHTHLRELEVCMAVCKPAAVVISVRDPYTWYTSAYHEAIRTGWLAGRTLDATVDSPALEPAHRNFYHAVLANLTTFMQFIAGNGTFPQGWFSPQNGTSVPMRSGASLSLTGVLRRTCGARCSSYVVLHQESLVCQAQLLAQSVGLPLPALRQIRVASNGSSGLRRPHHRISPQVCELISRTDEVLFKELGYPTLDCLSLPANA